MTSSMESRLSISTCFITLFFFLLKSLFAIDTIPPNQILRDNGQTLVSAGGQFELGFFSPLNSNNRYIGIWFKTIPQQTVYWVANRDNPLTDSSGVLMITATGNVTILRNQASSPVWSSNSSTTSNNPILQLLDTGNLIVKDGDSENYVWQSFDHPFDTMIPGVKLGLNLQTGKNWFLNSWKSLEDPSTGDYTYKIDPQGLPQLVLRRGTEILFRSGPWDGIRFGGDDRLEQNSVFDPIFVDNDEFIYYTFENTDNTTISRFVLNQSGVIQHLSWNQRRGEWVVIAIVQTARCEEYALCGPNGFCNMNKDPVCYCPSGFVPKVPEDWNALNWFDGCVEKTSWNCSSATKFRKYSKLKLPDNSEFLVNNSVRNRMECEQACLNNCSCVAYTYAGTLVTGCVVWFGSLIDIREFGQDGFGQDLYVRLAASEFVIYCYVTRKRAQRKSPAQEVNNPNEFHHNNSDEDDMDLPLFDWQMVESATNHFAFTNKIGEGGFGPVYRIV
ncbi:S-locus glycoprotein [Corchorus olitorius]|uniref:S-locus glycoprotein n=1 Tax=Corchorus olitorius TaxID=93759 RepID=A0A1R3H3T1_9ROSI|nr:S-locus glycoprotein [Corchorus olitorius]